MLFDLYQRYKKTQEIIDILRNSNDLLDILEVGPGEQKNLGIFLPRDRIVYLDIKLSDCFKNDPSFIEGDAIKMPFPDGRYDYIVALDVFEHISPNSREKFLDELDRCSKYGFILAFPFDDERITLSETRANEYFKALHGIDHPWLKEHRENGLPQLEETLNYLRDRKIGYHYFYHGFLDLWEKLIMVHFTTINNDNIHNKSLCVNDYYNSKLYKKDFKKPCYRCFIVALNTRQAYKLARLKRQICSQGSEISFTKDELMELDKLLEDFYTYSLAQYGSILRITQGELKNKEEQIDCLQKKLRNRGIGK